MIRRVVPTEETDHAVFGATYKGLAVVAFEIGVTFAAVLLSVVAFNRAGDVAEKNCRAITTLAEIQHTQVQGQRAQTKALLKKGLTFGLSPKDLAGAIAKGEVVTARFLRELDELAARNC